MKLTEDYADGVNVIQGYEHNGININGRLYSRSLVVSNRQLEDNWLVTDITQLVSTDLEPLLAPEPEVIIIGTGKRIIFPSPAIYANVIRQGIGIEFMDTPAACRTYNILVSENRKVSAGIILNLG